jgi:hypothetical protein
MSLELQNFLELNLPKVKDGKKPKLSLGVTEPNPKHDLSSMDVARKV